MGIAALLCAFTLQAESTGLTAYRKAKQRWQTAALHDYQFTLVHTCFCFGEANGPLRVTVRVFVDYYKMMADEELIYTLSDFSH